MSTPTAATTYPPTDPRMVSALRRGDDDAWERFEAYHRELIRLWACRAGCPPDAVEDVCQEALLALLHALPGFRHSGRAGSFHAFVRTIVRRRVYDCLRRRASRDETSVEGRRLVGLMAPDAGQSDPDLPWVTTLVSQASRRVQERTDPITWESFLRYAVQSVPVETVQADLGIDRAGTVYQQKSRVLTLLRKEMLHVLEALGDVELEVLARSLTTKDVLQATRAILLATASYTPVGPIARAQ